MIIHASHGGTNIFKYFNEPTSKNKDAEPRKEIATASRTDEIMLVINSFFNAVLRWFLIPAGILLEPLLLR
jgi:hypothetical protein